EDRPDLLHAALRVCGKALRQRRAWLEVPGPDGPDAESLLAKLRARADEMKVLVTGGTGFVGPGVVRALADKGHDLKLLVREATKDLVPYYHAKWEMEQAVKGSGLEHVIFRPSFVFGRDGGILPTFRKLAKLTPMTPVIGSGEQRIQPIWIDDVGAYFAAAVT